MTSNEIVNILENEIFDGFEVKYKEYQSVPMGRSLHFTVTPNISKETVDKQMIEKFGRSFNSFDGTDYLFIVTNGTKLERK